MGYIADVETKKDLIRKSKGLINLAFESAGMTTLEAMLCGVPVFGYSKGGTAELVDPESGVLNDSKKIDDLLVKFREFQMKDWDVEAIRERALEVVNG